MDHTFADAEMLKAIPCPECGCGESDLLFRHCCQADADTFPEYRSWLECPDCGRKGKTVSNRLGHWMIFQMSHDAAFQNSIITNWNSD